MSSSDAADIRVTLLGTGTSTGIPVIGCTCRVCQSPDPRDKRLRCSCLIEVNDLHILIDAGPDFRTQAIRAGIERIDAVLITHHHFDHIVGLDDLRPFFFLNRNPIPCYAHPDTAGILREMFRYIFQDGTYPGVAKLEMREVSGPIAIQGRYNPERSVTVTPLEVYHGAMPVLGFRIGRFAYITDTNKIPASCLPTLEDLDVLVLDALRHEPHRSHFTIAQAIEAAQEIGPRQTYFTHMTHHILHEEEDARLPEGMALAYDTQSFVV
jgi:phosphoribosyl 1,2-cyclic phosphate phosphodiesterase